MKESPSLANVLLGQIENKKDRLVLTEKSPVLEFLPPFLMKESIPSSMPENRFGFCSFPSQAKLQEKFPDVLIKKGHPKEIYQFLKGSSDVALNFDQLGFVYLTRDVSLQNCDERMRSWLGYALSPELWGPEGKWSRFHERLLNIFEKHKLLEGSPHPGYYPLKIDGRSWESFPFQGDLTKSSYDLILPWAFSLSELKKLESLLNEER